MLSLRPRIHAYISDELVLKREKLPLESDTKLLESGILNSLSLLKLVFFLEENFGVTIDPEELIPENFETIAAICNFVGAKKRSIAKIV